MSAPMKMHTPLSPRRPSRSREPDTRTFEVRVADIRPKLLGYARRLVPTEEMAIDLVSDTIIDAWGVDPENTLPSRRQKRWDRSSSSFYSWCRLLCLHIWHERNRHAKPPTLSIEYQQELDEEGFRDTSMQQPDRAPGGAVAEDFVTYFLRHLTPEERKVVIYRDQGYTPFEIARFLRTSTDRVNDIIAGLQVLLLKKRHERKGDKLEEDKSPTQIMNEKATEVLGF